MVCEHISSEGGRTKIILGEIAEYPKYISFVNCDMVSTFGIEQHIWFVHCIFVNCKFDVTRQCYNNLDFRRCVFVDCLFYDFSGFRQPYNLERYLSGKSIVINTELTAYYSKEVKKVHIKFTEMTS